jgi:flagella synthesis protein FlgN
MRLAEGVQADLVGFRSLHGLLDEQFAAALRHQSAQLSELAERITALCAEAEERRKQRAALLDALAPETKPNTGAQMLALFALLPVPHGAAASEAWQTLERLVEDCKALNTRNCTLMMDQYDIMQRVLSNESETYAPA